VKVYELKYWQTEEDKENDKSFIYDDYTDKKLAIDRAEKNQSIRGWFAVAVVDEKGKVVYENDFGDYAKGGEMYYRGGKYDRGTRPSPRESATIYRVGERIYGQDGNLWEIVENRNAVKRWQKVRIWATGGQLNKNHAYSVTIVWVNDEGVYIKFRRFLEADTKEEAVKIGKELLKKEQVGDPESSLYHIQVAYQHQLSYYLNADAVVIADDLYITDWNEKRGLHITTRDGKTEEFEYVSEENEFDFHYSQHDMVAYYTNADESKVAIVDMYSKSGNPDNPDPDITDINLAYLVDDKIVPLPLETGEYKYQIYELNSFGVNEKRFTFLSNNPDLTETEPTGTRNETVAQVPNESFKPYEIPTMAKGGIIGFLNKTLSFKQLFD